MAAILYTGQGDFDSIVLRWLALEKGAPIEIVRLDVHSGQTTAPPFLVDRDLQLFDHWVIVEFLQERYPSVQLMPVDPPVRAQIRQICSMVRAKEVSREELYTVLQRVNPYALGSTFTMADIYVGARVVKYSSKPEHVRAYIQRLKARKAYKEAS